MLGKLNMKLVVVAILFIALVGRAYTLALSDFVPNFLVPDKESSNNQPVKPLIDLKRNASGPSWYCNRMKNAANNIFCNKNDSSGAVAKIINDNGSRDQTAVVDNSASGNYAQSNSNLAALQDQKTMDYNLRQPSNFSVPIQPTKDVNVNVGQQQIEINIKY